MGWIRLDCPMGWSLRKSVDGRTWIGLESRILEIDGWGTAPTGREVPMGKGSWFIELGEGRMDDNQGWGGSRIT